MSSRGVRLLAAGGTIAMAGALARPADGGLEAAGAIGEAVLAGPVETVVNRPSVLLEPGEALALARRACELAASGDGVVVTCGTDLMEEVALLCDLLHDGEAPIVFTGAMRSASTPGADGPANLRDAVAVARSAEAAGTGVLVCFAGELHAAHAVRKVDSTGPTGFGSPGWGPIGRVAEERVSLLARPARRPAIAVERLDARVEIVHVGLAADGRVVDLVAGAVDGLVVVLVGAGHLSPQYLRALERARRRIPVVAVARPLRGSILRSTYGFEGAEGDVRAAGIVCAGALSADAARIKLMVCLGAGMDADAIAGAFAADDR